MNTMAREKVGHRERTDRYAYGKRVQDILLSAAVMMVLLPWMLLVCLVIVWDSPGAPPIFVQTRVGKDGKEFKLYKFRTMIPHAECVLPNLLQQNEMDGPVFKSAMTRGLHVLVVFCGAVGWTNCRSCGISSGEK